jgi:molybdopterin-guanine dinucleotide biosynthesis protein A
MKFVAEAGFVLAGGRSSRMGRDKALLECNGSRLIGRVAEVVAAAAGVVAIIGDPAKYGKFGYPVHPDVFVGCGPLAGIHAALKATSADWNLVVACDMPDVNAAFLRELLRRAEERAADCLVPAGASGRLEPLCAVYHRRALPTIERSLDNGIRKVVDGLAGLRIEVLRLDRAGPFRNVNTPEEWIEYTEAQNYKTRDKDT